MVDVPPLNPWGLTEREAAVMTALVEHGCHKLAARALNRSQKTIEAQLATAAKRMPHRTSLLRFIAWDRWLRSQTDAGRTHDGFPEASHG